MTSRYEVKMDGVSLAAQDSSICVLDIQPGAVSPQYRTSRAANRHGARVDDLYVEKSVVKVLFEIHKYSIADRMEVCQKVQKWARKGILTTNDRAGQRLHAVCESFPAANAKSWTAPLEVAFAGYFPPFWEDDTETTVTVSSGQSTSKNIPGNAPETLVSAVVTAGAALDSMTLTVNGKSLVLSGISVSTGGVVTVGYDGYGDLFVRNGNTSILNKVTAASADDLRVPCGTDNVPFAFASSAAATCVYKLRGCWY